MAPTRTALLVLVLTLAGAGRAGDPSCPSIPLIETPAAIFTEHLRQIFFDLNPASAETQVRLINYRVVQDRIALYFEVASSRGAKYYAGYLAKLDAAAQDFTIVKAIQSEDFGDLVRFFGDQQTRVSDTVNCLYLKEFFYITLFNNNFITPLFQQNVDVLINKDLFELVQASLQGLEAEKTRAQKSKDTKGDGLIKKVEFSSQKAGAETQGGTSKWPSFGGNGTAGEIPAVTKASGSNRPVNPHLATNPMMMADSARAKAAREGATASAGNMSGQSQLQREINFAANDGGSKAANGSAGNGQLASGNGNGNYMIGRASGQEEFETGSSGSTKKKTIKAVGPIPTEAPAGNATTTVILPKIIVKSAQNDAPAETAATPKIRPTEWSVSNPDFYKKYSIVRSGPTRRLRRKQRAKRFDSRD